MNFPGRGSLGTERMNKMDNLEMSVYEIGKKVMEPRPDGVTFDMTDGGGVLVIHMANPTAAEKAAFNEGIRLRFAMVDDIIFILARMGRLQWMDAPYYRALSKNLTHLDIADEGQGLALHAMLADGATGVLVAQKMIGLPETFSRRLMAAIIAQPIIPDYSARLQKVMTKYSTSALLEEAKKLC